jgi:hypothetical protein
MTEDRTAGQTGEYPFTPAELERLYAFRQAVLAGFYTDQIDERVAERSAKSHSTATRGRPQSPSEN